MEVRISLKIIFILVLQLHQHNTAKCNKKFIEAHMLTGLEESVPVPLTICPFVKERCCSIADEIKIIKYYKEGTVVIMNQH